MEGSNRINTFCVNMIGKMYSSQMYREYRRYVYGRREEALS
jgi:hypothetical protein